MLYLLIRAGFEPFRARYRATLSNANQSPDLLAPGSWLLCPWQDDCLIR